MRGGDQPGCEEQIVFVTSLLAKMQARRTAPSRLLWKIIQLPSNLSVGFPILQMQDPFKLKSGRA